MPHAALDAVLAGGLKRRERLARLALSELCGLGPIDKDLGRPVDPRGVRERTRRHPCRAQRRARSVAGEFRDRAHLAELAVAWCGGRRRMPSGSACATAGRAWCLSAGCPAGPVLVLRRGEPGNATFERLVAAGTLDPSMADLLRCAAGRPSTDRACPRRSRSKVALPGSPRRRTRTGPAGAAGGKITMPSPPSRKRNRTASGDGRRTRRPTSSARCARSRNSPPATLRGTPLRSTWIAAGPFTKPRGSTGRPRSCRSDRGRRVRSRPAAPGARVRLARRTRRAPHRSPPLPPGALTRPSVPARHGPWPPQRPSHAASPSISGEGGPPKTTSGTTGPAGAARRPSTTFRRRVARP